MTIIRSMLDKYKMLKLGVKAALWFTICNVLQKSITMITMPIFTRLLTTEQYGVLTVYNSWYSVISIIVTLNLAGGLINNGMVKFENRRNEFISAMQGLSFSVTAVFFIVYLVAQNFWNKVFDLSSVFMLTMFVQLLFEPAYLFWSQRQRYEYKYKSLVAVTLGVSLTAPVLGIIAVLSTEYKAEARVVSFALVQVCAGLIFFGIQAYRGKKLFVGSFWKFALRFNLPLIPHYLAQIILGQSDRIMIGRMTGNSYAAIYGVAYNIATVVTLFINALNSSFIPSMYQNLSRKNYKDIRKTADFLCLFMTVAISVFMLLGPEAIKLLAAPEYSEAKWVFPPVATSVFFVYIYTLFINLEFYFEKTHYVMFASVICAGLNILLNYIFIAKYGYIAAAYTTVLCYALFAVAHYFVYRYIAKKEKVQEPVFDGFRITLYSVVVLAAMGVSLLLYNYNLVRYIVLGVIALIALINIKKLTAICKTLFFEKKE
ncbi:MAG: oligosaccharide flippase family protein [Eubacterium sp.]|nr:oligosaccharide flippase family protein [Eubacterium sp.]